MSRATEIKRQLDAIGSKYKCTDKCFRDMIVLKRKKKDFDGGCHWWEYKKTKAGWSRFYSSPKTHEPANPLRQLSGCWT